MASKTIAAGLVFICLSCQHVHSQENNEEKSVKKPGSAVLAVAENPYKNISEIPLPEGFTFINPGKNSFSYWLLNIPLKKDKTVYLFDGSKKRNQAAQFAVLDIPVGTQNLQQCADAVIRLRASYLFEQGKFDSIVFYDNELRPYLFSQPYTKKHFTDYLQRVFSMCGTASLSKQLKKILYPGILPGNVLIRGGFPGHAEIVLAVAVNKSGAKKYLLAQSYMPAQDIHVLLNPLSKTDSPWYDFNDEKIETPEYTFTAKEWKEW
ncbi:MAG: hypothetical protein H7258_07005 [Ferruginibacter sp.]|nr:hypothetical protein [Ferruginibacter sp.]